MARMETSRNPFQSSRDSPNRLRKKSGLNSACVLLMVVALEELQLARRDGLGQNPGKSEVEEFFAVLFTRMGGEGIGLGNRTARGL